VITKWFQKLLRKQNDKYPTTPRRDGKRIITICGHCSAIMPGAMMEMLPYESKTKQHLPVITFDTYIRGEWEKNLRLEPCLTYADSLVKKNMFGEYEPFHCQNCGNLPESVVSVKLLDTAVLLCI
jgi:hypothetical protein